MINPDIKKEQVMDLINSVLVRVRAPEELSREIIHAELNDLKSIITNLKDELATSQPDAISKSFIPDAADELEAVVYTTEKATGTIMDACDEILSIVDNSAVSDEVQQRVIRVFEACSFQDITGQRIKKVIRTLSQIDEKIKSLLSVMESQFFEPAFAEYVPADQSGEYLSGPALPRCAVSQDDIDMLFEQLEIQ